MLTGEMRNRVDKRWDTFGSGSISNPIVVIEQITYLLVLKRLDESHTLEEESTRLNKATERSIFPTGTDKSRGGRPYEHQRWSMFKRSNRGKCFDVIAKYAFPFLCQVQSRSSTISNRPPRHLAELAALASLQHRAFRGEL
jgi:type I restriction enzyme M protein